MKIMIVGASGLVGGALVDSLRSVHDLVLVGRDASKLKKRFSSLNCLSWLDLKSFNEEVDVIIHLSGENVGAGYWTDSLKHKIMCSRVETTQWLLDWLKTRVNKPRILAANAIGYYGIQADIHFDETSPVDDRDPQCFLQEVAFAWQNAWNQTDLKLSICWMRFGVVLKKGEGMLKKLWPSFYFGAGAIIGHGQQMISWIDIDDLVAAIVWLIEHTDINGPINLCAPKPVSQYEFARALATAMHRPLCLTLPAWLVRLLFGQMGQELLLSGQAVYPKRLLDHGFKFKYPEIQKALELEVTR
jgi:uncharacterized protein (TIGR01777 family)